jgi:hypothetical protein
MAAKTVFEVTRSISRNVERELWAITAARCEFNGCNRRLNISPVTKESGNFVQKAHIYSFSPDGPRGRGPYQGEALGLNQSENLMLLCYDCHKKIDADKNGARYSAGLLRQWKHQHEARIRLVTGISPDKGSHVLLYGARIGEESRLPDSRACFEAMFPDWYPSDENPINLSMHSASDDSSSGYWHQQLEHLEKQFDRYVRGLIEDSKISHLSVFGFAPQPLLIRLGSLITDKVPAMVYQPHREPQTWKWQPHPENFEFLVIEPEEKTGPPVLVFSLSAKIAHERVWAALGRSCSVWELTSTGCHNDFLRSEAQISMFRKSARHVLAKIKEAHPGAKELPVFPAMPISCAIELGRVRMPKADIPWVIYDQNNKRGGFIESIRIG